MASQGPNSPGTVVDDAAVGNIAWTDPGNAASSDNSYVTASMLGSGDITHYLKATNFGFTIPAGATIDSISFQVEAADDVGGFTSTVTGVYLVVGSNVVGNDVSTGTGLTTTDGYKNRNNITPATLGVTPTVAEINDAGFGWAVRFSTGDLCTIRVDHMRMTINYTEAVAGHPAGKRMGGVEFASPGSAAIKRW